MGRKAALALLLSGLSVFALGVASSGSSAHADPLMADDELVLTIVPWRQDFCELLIRGKHLEPMRAYSLAIGATTLQFYARPNGSYLGRFHDHRAAWNSSAVSSMGPFTLTWWDGGGWASWAPGSVTFALNSCSSP